MLFIYPMWDNESQRIGKQKCTRVGYALHGIAEGLGFLGLLILLGSGLYIAYRWIAGSFDARLLWLIAMPFGLGIIGEVLYQFSWWLAGRRGWQYNWDKREASWMENGQRRTYSWEDAQKERT